jgi:hypothetical protein
MSRARLLSSLSLVLALAPSVVLAAAVAACGGGGSTGANATGEDATADGAEGGQNAGGGEGGWGGGNDGPSGDDSAADSTVDAPGQDVGTAPAEAGGEAGPVDAGSEAAPEEAGGGTEASTDGSSEGGSSDAGRDADASATDASDAATCIESVYGDFYGRADGTLVYGPTSTAIVDDATSVALTGITQVVDISGYFACGLRGDGTVWCWPIWSGETNSSGELGNGHLGGTVPAIGHATQVVTNAADAGAPTYLTGVTSISVQTNTSYTSPVCAIRSDKTVWCWGSSTAQTVSQDGLFWGTTGSVASEPYAIEIAAGPPNDAGVRPKLTADQVSVGFRHACVLLAGKVSCWGTNIAGNLGDGTYNYQAYPVPVTTGYGLPATIDAVGCGADFTCALASGDIWCWGTSAEGQLGNPSVPKGTCGNCTPFPVQVQEELPDGGVGQVPDGGVNQHPFTGATFMRIGYQFGCALDGAGTVWCWGAAAAGSTFTPVAAPFSQYVSGVPTTGVTHLSAIGEGFGDSLRYVTSSGVYVDGTHVATPSCQ